MVDCSCPAGVEQWTVLLPADLPGINDPCERNPQQDILDSMTAQQREDLTRTSQRYLRKLAFREIHQVRARARVLRALAARVNDPLLSRRYSE